MAYGGGIMPQDFNAVESATALLGQVTLDPKLDASAGTTSSTVLTARSKFTRKYSLRELEIQQTIGTCPRGSRGRDHPRLWLRTGCNRVM